MREIVIDTNFATIPFQFKVDIFQEFQKIMESEYFITFPKICLEELERLKYGKPALKLLKDKNVKIVDIEKIKNVDNSIIEYAKSKKAMIATQDKELKKKALKERLCVITLRQKKYLKVIYWD